MRQILLFLALAFIPVLPGAAQKSWTADNGNGTYTNPLFYDEFSDPDLIRVGNDFYLAGTTMHCTPGLVVLHSKDLVNWTFQSYCFNSYADLGLNGDEFKLNGKTIYGQGIWAPCIRYHNGKFYVFSNINNVGLQVFISENPAGPWRHINMGGRIYDLSVLFDDDGRIWAVHKYNEVHLTEIKPDFSGYVEGSDRVIIPAGNAMGEGHHIYKINGKYYIISANYSPCGRMQCARADKIEGPYETVVISAEESLGTMHARTVQNVGLGGQVPQFGFDFRTSGSDDNFLAAATLHQGGIVDLPNGEWWGFSMNDFRAVGRTTNLSPVTWVNGWPYFGLPNNLGRSPRTWLKPNVSAKAEPSAPYRRSDDFNGKTLLPVWQWNHDAVNRMWNLSGGTLNLKTMPATDILWAKNTLTQRCIGPVSSATVTLNTKSLKDGDFAGLALINTPYLLIGVKKQGGEQRLVMLNELSKQKIEKPLSGNKIYLRATGDYDEEHAGVSYSTDGTTFEKIGDEMLLAYQLLTFQGSRYALFAFNGNGKNGGTAQFDNFTVIEPMADRTANLPIGKVISLKNLGNGTFAWANPHGMLHSAGPNSKEYRSQGCFFKVLDRGKGQVALEAMNGTGFLTVVGAGLSADVRMFEHESQGSLFMWQDMLRGQCMLLSMKTHRYVGIDPTNGAPYSADKAGCNPDRRDGTVFQWQAVESDGVVKKTEKPSTY
jgi:beta-xylosidase